MKQTVKNIVKIVSNEFTKFIEGEPNDNMRYTLATSSNVVLIRQNKPVDDSKPIIKNIYLNISYKSHPMGNISVRILNGNTPKVSIEYNIHHPQYLKSNSYPDGLDSQRIAELIFSLQRIATEINM